MQTHGERRGRRQLELDLRPHRRGGKRKGAGRPRKNVDILHLRRPDLSRHVPVHATLRVRPDVPRLRGFDAYPALRAAIAAAHNAGFRVCEYSVQQNHIHLIVEADDRVRLARGMQGMAIRMARGVNRRLGRRGPILQHRYNARQLRTPREVRIALVYVLRNHTHHSGASTEVDDCSSGLWFTGWAYPIRDMRILAERGRRATAPPKTWLLVRGWRERGGGPLTWRDRPAPAAGVLPHA